MKKQEKKLKFLIKFKTKYDSTTRYYEAETEKEVRKIIRDTLLNSAVLQSKFDLYEIKSKKKVSLNSVIRIK